MKKDLYFILNKNIIYWLGMICFSGVLSCAPLQIREGIFFPPHRNYSVNIPENRWKPIKLNKEDITLWNKQYNATIAIISTEIDNEKLSLEIFADRLFISMQNKEIVSRESILVNNQKAIRTILTGEIDNYKLKIDSYVMETDNKVYDLMYWAPPDSFNYLHGDFQNMVKTFKFI